MDSAFDQLGTMKPINRSSKPEELLDVVALHQRALVEFRGDLQAYGDRIERMIPETQKLLKEAKRDARMEWVPGGDVAAMDARYCRTDGAVMFGRSIEDVPFPDGSIERVVRHGLLTDPYPVTKAQEKARNAYASFALAFARANAPRNLGARANIWSDSLVRKSWMNLRAALLALPGRVGEYVRAMHADPALFKRVVDKTSGQGGELILVPTISDLRRPMDLQRRIPGLFARKSAPARSFTQPIVTGRGVAKLRGATTDDPARYPVRRFTTSNTTITVVDQEITALLDPLWVADAATILGDPMGFVMDWLESGYIDTLELADLHGDTAGTHQDTIATWTMGGYYTAGDLDGSSSPLKWWIGVRARAADDSTAAAGGGSFDAADHFSTVELMGNHAGGNVVAITGLHCLYTQLLQYSNFLTVDKMGAKATLLTGEIGKIGKEAVIISEFMPNDLNSSAGLYTGSGTTTAIAYVDVDAYDYYELDDGSNDFDVTYPEKGAEYVGLVRRGVLVPNCISTEKPTAYVYNL